MPVVVEGVAVRDLRVDAADSEVHLGELRDDRINLGQRRPLVMVVAQLRRLGLDLLFNPKYSIPLRARCPSVWVCHGLDWYVMPQASRFIDRLKRDRAKSTVGQISEFGLLETLLRNPRQVLTRGALFEAVWNYELGPTTNVLEVYIGYLRRKMELAGEPRLLHTVRGVGYTLRLP